MRPKGFSHVGLATLDIDETRAFYEGVLGFPVRVFDTIRIKSGGRIRHAFFDTGRDQLIAFMELRGPGMPAEFDPGVNKALGLPTICYHFAFEAGNEAALVEKRAELIAKGVEVSPVLDHGWSKSIYFKDPNGIQLEYCAMSREFTPEDAVEKVRLEATLGALNMEDLNGITYVGGE